MRTAPIQLHKMRPETGFRATAWLLVWVCAWMGTVGVLHHTDRAFAVLAKSQASHLGQQAAVPAADTCAACEWTQGLTAKTSSVCRLPSPLFLLHPYIPSLTPRMAPRPLRLCSSRGPPLPA